MSLILDALRKSEAERRRGQTPDLLSEAVPVASPAPVLASGRRGTLLALVGLVALTAIILLAAFWSGSPAEPVTPTAAVDTPPLSPEPTAMPATDPTPAATAMKPAAAPAPPTSVPPASAAPAPAAATVPPQSIAAAASVSAAAPLAGPAAERAQKAVAATSISALSAPPAAVADPPPGDAVRFVSPDSPLRLSELSSEERAQLPTLKVSMHMWAPDASHRFAIIDGSRVGEGDRVGDAMVEAIGQDGVMLAWRGRRISLPIR